MSAMNPGKETDVLRQTRNPSAQDWGTSHTIRETDTGSQAHGVSR